MRFLIRLRRLKGNPTTLLAGILLGAILAGCGNATPPPPADAPWQTLYPSATPTSPPTNTIPLPAILPSPIPPTVEPSPPPSSTTVLPAPSPSATFLPPTAGSSPTSVQPTPFSTPPLPRPTPNPGSSSWVKERLDAVIALYRPTPAGDSPFAQPGRASDEGRARLLRKLRVQRLGRHRRSQTSTCNARTDALLLGRVSRNWTA